MDVRVDCDGDAVLYRVRQTGPACHTGERSCFHHSVMRIGMSGGVDSAVAALLLKREGHEVVGLFMKNWEDDDTDNYCSSRADLVDAVAAAELIGIEIDAVNFSAEYKERVFTGFLAVKVKRPLAQSADSSAEKSSSGTSGLVRAMLAPRERTRIRPSSSMLPLNTITGIKLVLLEDFSRFSTSRPVPPGMLISRITAEGASFIAAIKACIAS